MNVILLLLLISALVACTGFVGIYASYSPWRINPAGRSMMLLAVSLIFLILSGVLLTALGPDYPGRTVFRLITYTLLNVALWRQLILLIRVQNEAFRAKQPRPPIPLPRDAEVVELVDTAELPAQGSDKTSAL